MNKRKYLMARYVLKPKTRMTQVAGWQSDPAKIQWDEQVGFATKLRSKDHQEWQVILDLANNTVVQASTPSQYEGQLFAERNYDKIFEYYNQHYGEQIKLFVSR